MVPASLLVPFLIHLIMVRYLGLFRDKPLRQKGAIISCLLGYLPIGFLFSLWAYYHRWYPGAGLAWSGFFIFSVYTLLAYVYFHIFNMSETARRIRILAESRQRGKVTRTEIVREYTCERMVKIRLDRLVALRELRLKNGRYTMGRGRLLFPARIVFGFRRILFPRKIHGRNL